MAAIIRAFQKGIQNGLSVDVIIKEYGLNISTATAYRYIDAHLIPAVKNIDLKAQDPLFATFFQQAKDHSEEP